MFGHVLNRRIYRLIVATIQAPYKMSLCILFKKKNERYMRTVCHISPYEHLLMYIYAVYILFKLKAVLTKNKAPTDEYTKGKLESFPALLSSTVDFSRNHLREIPYPKYSNSSDHLLIGRKPPANAGTLESETRCWEPHGVRTVLGLTINGPVNSEKHHEPVNHNFIYSMNDNASLELQVERFSSYL